METRNFSIWQKKSVSFHRVVMEVSKQQFHREPSVSSTVCFCEKQKYLFLKTPQCYYDVSITNYDCKQLEGKKIFWVPLWLSVSYKNKQHVWTCVVITFRLRTKRGQKSYREQKHVFHSHVWSSNYFTHLQLWKADIFSSVSSLKQHTIILCR